MYENVIGDEEIIMHKIHMPDNIKEVGIGR